MRFDSTSFLRLVIYAVGLAVLGLCAYVLPSLILADVLGYYRPILIGMYLPAIPFYIALFYALKLLHYIDTDAIFSKVSVAALRWIKYCGFVIAVLYALGMPYIFSIAERDDAPGVAALGLGIIFASTVVATAAGVFQRLLQSAVALKSENDLTV